jgi:DNA-binding CsgD family transcriptional regulator
MQTTLSNSRSSPVRQSMPNQKKPWSVVAFCSEEEDIPLLLNEKGYRVMTYGSVDEENAAQMLEQVWPPHFHKVRPGDWATVLHITAEESAGVVLVTRTLLEGLLRALPVLPETDLECGVMDLGSQEADLVRFAAKGLRNRELAQALHVTAKTLRRLLRQLYSRYRVTNRVELLWCLIERGHVLKNRLQRPEQRIVH